MSSWLLAQAKKMTTGSPQDGYLQKYSQTRNQLPTEAMKG